MKIVYCSNAGHAKRYAEILGEKLNLEVVSIDKANKITKDEPVIFIGWVFANNVSKLNKIKNICNVIVVIAVGMTAKSDSNTKLLIDTNQIQVPFFYLRGGIDYSKLKGVKRFILKMVAKSVIEQNKEDDKEIIEVFKNGGDFVSKDGVEEIVTYFNNKVGDVNSER